MRVWITAIVLQVLAKHDITKAGDAFYAHELTQWVQGQLVGRQRTSATTRLIALEFLTHEVKVLPEVRRVDQYTLTEAGAAAVAEAAAGKVRKHGKRKSPELDKSSLAWRLWDLLRIRKALESDAAAELLCDAGGDNKRMQDTIRKYLRDWALQGAVVEARRRVRPEGNSSGVKRYVLHDDFKATLMPPRQKRKRSAKGQS